MKLDKQLIFLCRRKTYPLPDMADSERWVTVIRTSDIISDMNKNEEHEAET